MPILLGIVENEPLLLATLVSSLDGKSGIQVVSQGVSGSDVLTQARDRNLDVALLDVHLGAGLTGFDLAKSLRQIDPSVGIIFLSSVKDPRLLGFRKELLPVGSRYLLKSQVAEIGKLVDEVIAVAEDSRGSEGKDLPSVPFTQSQIEILRLVAAGYSNTAIAEERFVTERAVEIAVSRLARHLGLREAPGVNKRVHIAATFFREMGWTP